MNAKTFAAAVRFDGGSDRASLRDARTVLEAAGSATMEAKDFADRLRRGGKPGPSQETLKDFRDIAEGRKPCPKLPTLEEWMRGFWRGAKKATEMRLAEAVAEAASRPRSETRSLTESYDQGGVRVAEGVLKGVKILGFESLNRRRYTPEAVRDALRMYEGAKVNVNHPANPQGSRGVEDRFGRLVNVRQEADGLYGDLRFNPQHRQAKAVTWWASNDPDAVGLSHNAVGQGFTAKDGTFVVQKIVSVRSVDLVADPATTGGLFGSA